MLRSPLFPAIATAVLLFGCSGPRPAVERDLPAAFPNHTATQIRFQLLEPVDTLTSFRAKASLAFRAPENSGSFTADLHERRGDSLFVAISPGLGIEAARALVTPDSFFFYDRIKNQVLFGGLDQASHLLPEPFTSDDIFMSLLGLLVPSDNVQWAVEADDEYYYLRDRSARTLFVVDPSLWRVVRFERSDGSGETTERHVFSDFVEFDGVVLPRRLTFERPREDRRASLYYRSMRLNPDELNFALDVRDGATHVPVGE